MRHTGEKFIASAEYRSDCHCEIHVGFPRDTIAPVCPRCHRAVTWIFVRSPYVDPRGPRLALPDIHRPLEPDASVDQSKAG